MKVRILILALLVLIMIPTVAQAETYSRAKTRHIVADAAWYYHLNLSERIWLENAAIDIIYIGHHESGGNTSAGKAHECVGILQFNSGWHFNLHERRYTMMHNTRLSGYASLYRFARVMRDGGKAAIRRHWSATLGR